MHYSLMGNMRLPFKDNQVLGYSIALRASKVADLLNICIHPDYQHQGLGTVVL
jgi:ribosomal protein S18 acetylase RimI-like enzyme